MPTISLTAQHLPADIASLLDQYTQAQQTAREAQRTFDTAPIQQRHQLKDATDQAHAAAATALEALSTATARSNQQIRDSAAGSFYSHIEAARVALAEAETQMRLAAAAAGLYATATARPGRRILDAGGEAAARSGGKQRAMLVVSEIRDVVGLLPDAID